MKTENLMNMVDSLLPYVEGEAFMDLQTISTAINKQIPKEPRKTKIDKVTNYWCPKCGGYIGNGYDMRYRDWETDRKSTRLNSSHSAKSRMPSSA